LLRSVYIKRFLSGFLLIVFTLSITPKKYLHDIFAKHVDISYKKSGDKVYQLTSSGFNCNCDNLVAESSFVIDQHLFSFPIFNSFSAFLIKDISFSSVPGIYSSLRGPPENI